VAGLLSAAQLAAFRAVASSALDIPGVIIQRATLADDGYGIHTPTWSTVATVDASEAKPSAAVMAQYAARIANLTSWEMRFPWGTDILAGDQIIMPNGDTRLVQADLSDSSYSTANLYLVSELRP
jgi:Phage head-tail joining protein